MPLTIEKLRRRIAELGKAAEGPRTPLSPIFIAPAAGPMTPPPAPTDRLWQEVEVALSLLHPLSSLHWECNLLEEPIAEASHEGYTLQFQVRPFEIKTFRIHLIELVPA